MKKKVNFKLKVKLNAKLSKVEAKRMREQKILTYRGRGSGGQSYSYKVTPLRN